MASGKKDSDFSKNSTEKQTNGDDKSGKELVSERNFSSDDFLIKHPLHNKWALWFFKNDKKNWNDNQKLITTFDTVEDFWSLYNHIMAASKLKSGCDYSLFKDGIQPAWEDDQNQKGGRWMISLNPEQRSKDLDKFWLETLLCLIGEAFDDYGDHICGAVVNIRNKGDRLGVWTRDMTSNEAIINIGRKLKERLQVPPHISIGYQAHSDSKIKSNSSVRNRFTV